MFIRLFLVLMMLTGIASAGEGRLADHVVLVSIDGFRPDFYREAGWPTPNLQQMAAEGVSADFVRGVFPSVTYPSHTTIITGVMPARHGIFYNSPFEGDNYTGAWYWYEKEITARTIWDAAGDAGLTTASIYWPVSVGAPITYNFPEIWPDRNKEKAVKNKFAWQSQFVTPKSLFRELESEILGNLGTPEFDTDTLRFDVQTSLAACHMIEKYKPNLLTVHLILTDFAQHDYGRDSFRLRQALVGADHGIGLIREALKNAGIADRTAIIVVGDHGFVNIQSTLAPNVWLAEAGLRGVGKLGDDWKATFHTTGASAFLTLRDPEDSVTLNRVKEILDTLPAGRKKLFRVVDAEKLAEIGGPKVPLALSPAEGISLSYSARGADLFASHNKGGNHGYLPDFEDIYTGFIGYGSGFRKNLQTKLIGLEDIAPVICRLLNLEMNDVEGVAYPGFFAKPAKK